MPKRQAQRIIDSRRVNRSTNIIGVTGSGTPVDWVAGDGLTLTGTTLDVVAGSGISVAADAVAVDSTVVRTTRTVMAGSGLTGGGALSSDLTLNVGAGTLITVGADTVGITTGANYQYIGTGSGTAAAWQNLSGLAGAGLTHSAGVFAVGAGNGITVNADDVALTTPGTLTVSSTNSASGSHTHAVTSSSNPGAAASILASDASGYLSLVRLVASDRLRSPLLDTAAGNLTLQPAGDITIDPVGNDVLPATNYDINLGMLSKKYLTLHAAELWVETLVAQNTSATIGGRVLVGPTTTLTRDLATGDTTIYVRHNQMQVGVVDVSYGDITYLEADGKVEFLRIISGPVTISATEYSYGVTRNLDGSGANEWFAGDAIFNTGDTGSGWIDLYSVRGVKSASQVGPTIVGNIRNSGDPSRYNDWSEAWAIGNLNGLYGYGSNMMGVGLGKYASGQPNIVIDPTNGVRLRQYTTDMIVLDPSGNSYFAGVMTIGTSGEIRQGTGTLGSNYTGLRIWRDSSVGRIAGYNNNTLQWYGDTSGNFVAGAGDVLLNANGYRQLSTTIEYPTTEPGASPVLPAINQRISLWDKPGTTDWGYNSIYSGPLYYSYPGLEWLRIYVSSQHYVEWYTGSIPHNTHAWDAVIEMPANTISNNAGTVTRRLLTIKAPTICLDGGNVGIGLSDPQVALQVHRSSGKVPLRLSTSANYGWELSNNSADAMFRLEYVVNNAVYSTPLAATYDGKVGIGTTSPAAMLDVNGRILAVTTGYDWSALTPGGGWNNYGSGNTAFGVKRFGTLVSIKGVLQASGSISSNTSIYTLVSEYRPGNARQFTCYGTPGAVRVVIANDGTIRPQSAFSTNDYLCLEITYFIGD
jgi:hypothetical protein